MKDVSGVGLTFGPQKSVEVATDACARFRTRVPTFARRRSLLRPPSSRPLRVDELGGGAGPNRLWSRRAWTDSPGCPPMPGARRAAVRSFRRAPLREATDSSSYDPQPEHALKLQHTTGNPP